MEPSDWQQTGGAGAGAPDARAWEQWPLQGHPEPLTLEARALGR